MGDFKFLTDEKIEQLDFTTVADDSPTGYIVKCDLEYPEKLHDLRSDYPLASNHMWCAELYCYHTRPQVADSGTASRYRG